MKLEAHHEWGTLRDVIVGMSGSASNERGAAWLMPPPGRRRAAARVGPSAPQAQRLLPVSFGGTVSSSFGSRTALPRNGNSLPK